MLTQRELNQKIANKKEEMIFQVGMISVFLTIVIMIIKNGG